jgi:signal transduction histidine kinase/ActR/RegA family two-component response regulator
MRPQFQLPKPPQLGPLARYSSVPLITGLMAIIQHYVLPVPHVAPFLFFFGGVVMCAWLAGRWPGLLAALLSGATANYFFVSPYEGWALSAPALTMTGLFLLVASTIALMCGSLRDAMIAAEQAAEQLREGQRLLREADEHKTHFMSVLSHELRNPLAPISSALFILDHTSPSAEQAARARAVIERQLRHLTRIVDDLLDVTRISRGKIELQRARVDLVEVVARTLADYRSLFRAHGIALELTLPQHPIWVDGDPTRLAQILSNLLANSAKFARGGTTWVTVEQHGDAAILRVRDDGAGMDPELLEHLFEPFVQADRTLARTSGGLGLGLALVKGLAELHGGGVTAFSAGEGTGSELTVVLPTVSAPSEATMTQPARESVTQSRRILVIEDNIDAALSLKEALEVSGHQVAVEHDGVAGIAKARAWRPEVVLCDIGLPSMSGYEVAKVLRSDRELEHTFLIALTGYALPEDREKAGQAGFDRHLAKPPLLAELERLIAQADDVPAVA